MEAPRIDDTPYRIIDVLRRGPATFRQVVLAPEFAGPVGGSIPQSFILGALLDLVDAGKVQPGHSVTADAGDVAYRLA